MKRRDFITLLGGAAAWPIAARGQQAALPVIGYLQVGSADANQHLLAAVRKGLEELGYVEGRNVIIEYRWANNNISVLPDLAADLVRRRVAVLVAGGGGAATSAAKAATATIPIVFQTGGDPVESGLAASLNRPGGNATGVSSISTTLGAKRLGLLQALLPGAASFAVLVNPNSPSAERVTEEMQAAAAAIDRRIEFLAAGNNRDIDIAVASVVQKRVDALLVSPSPLFRDRRVQLATLATYHRVPAIYYERDFTEVGGLMSYGVAPADIYRTVGVYVGRILKGEKPADLRVQQPTKFELLINLHTARTLGVEVPATLLAQADEVIE